MVVQNQTNDNVNWTQTGGPGQDKTSDVGAVVEQSGSLTAKGSSGSSETITPVGTNPWTVLFSSSTHPKVPSPAIYDANATVTLDADWTISVT